MGTVLSPSAALASALPAPGAYDVVAAAVGTFAAPPMFSEEGYALAVYNGGNIDQLEVAAQLVGAKGVWVQDTAGRYALLPVNGPAFLKAGFASAFPAAGAANGANGMNFPAVIAVTLVR